MSWQTPLLIPVVCSVAYWLLTAWAVTRFFERRLPARALGARRPRVSLIKPVCGLEKGLEENLATAGVPPAPLEDLQRVFRRHS